MYLPHSPPRFSVTQFIFLPNPLYLPEKVAAEDEAEHEDEEADAQHNDIHIEWEVIYVRSHAAVVFRALSTQTTQASCQEFANTDYKPYTCCYLVQHVSLSKLCPYYFLYG